MTLHAVVAGWLLGPPSGANHRLLALLGELGPALAPGERITVLIGAHFAPPPLPGITWRQVDVAPGPTWRRVLAERQLASVCDELGATVLDHGFLPPPRVDVPVCLLVHDTRAADGMTRWPRWLARRVLRHSCARAAAVVVPSRWTAGRVHELTGVQARVIENGVTLPASAELPPSRPPGLPGYLLHLGHLEPRKNLGCVIAALAKLPAATRPQLWLVGRDAGSGAAWQHAAAQAGVGLRQLGVVDAAGCDALLRAALAVVMPSRYEGFGLPVLEAFAVGQTVLAADATALPEVVGTAGTLLPADDPAAWASAIAALRPPTAAEVAARRAHAAAWPWPAAAHALLTLWRQLSG